MSTRRRLIIVTSTTFLIIIALLGLFIVQHIRTSQNTTQNKPGQATEATPTDTAASISSPGLHTFNFTHNGIERTYNVYLPKNYVPKQTYPLLIGLHGGFGSAEQFEASTGLDGQADTHNFIIAYGQGTSWGKLAAPVWNAGGCCGQAVTSEKNIDDVGYIRQIIKNISSSYAIDAQRVYATGMSNGGMMANRLACEASDSIHGVGIVSGTIQIDDCSPANHMPVLIMHGTADPRVLYNGGTSSGAIKITAIPVMREFADWANRNGCSGGITTTPIVTRSADNKTVDVLQYNNCAASTIQYRINGGEHEWPGGKTTTNQLEQHLPTQVIDASKTIVEFLGLAS